MPAGDRCPLPALVFNSMFSVPESWVAVSICESLCIPLPLVTVVSGLGPLLTVCGCGSVLAPAPLTSVSMDVRSRLHPPCRSVVWIPVLPSSIVAPMKWCTDFLHSRFWGLARWGHDPFPGGRAARHLLCHLHAPSVMLHMVTCSIVSRSVPPSQISVNCGVVDVPCIQIPSQRHSRLFNPTSSFNTFRTVLHVTFIGQACECFVSL